MGLEDELFNLKFTSKQLMRSAKKCEKEEKTERGKVKKAIEKGNHEGAKIYATNAIRKKNESLNYMRLSSKVDAVSARLEQAIRTGQITKSMGSVAKTMGKTLGSMNLEKVRDSACSFFIFSPSSTPSLPPLSLPFFQLGVGN
mmetsp:Transcript_12001/g.32523  ORF Transcript_12001/g.32523 Transcript_12001/m.32523 type:complete len:143 (-) Transcript_12001:1005-1433(-)